MKKQFILLITFLLIIISSCTKDSLSGTPYHSTYYKSGIIPAGAFRLFSSKGEITDKVLIDRFTEADSSLFNNRADEINSCSSCYYSFIDTVNFVDEHNALVIGMYNSNECKVMYQKGEFILTRSDVSTGYSSGEIFTRTINYFIGQIKPEVFTEYLVSSTRGNYEFSYSARFKYLFQRNREKMAAPIIQFLTHKDLLNWSGGGYVNNILQDDFYKNITTGDTVILRQYQLLYEKK